MDHSKYQRGISEAQDDIAKGNCRLFIQTRGSWGRRLTEIMRDGYGIEVVHVSDMTWESKSSFEEGYNTTIFAYLDAKHGAGYLGQDMGRKPSIQASISERIYAKCR